MRPVTHICTNCLKDIQLMLDGELDRHKENQLREEIEKCATCQAYYQEQFNYKKLISQKVQRRSCGDALKDALRLRIRGLG